MSHPTGPTGLTPRPSGGGAPGIPEDYRPRPRPVRAGPVPQRRPRVCVLFPHLQLGGGETAMIAVAEGLRRHAEISVCVLDRRPPAPGTAAAALDLRRELAARFPEVTLAASVEQIQAAFDGVDAVIWYGLNSLTPQALAGMPRRPRSLRVVHTDKDQEIEHHHRWRGVIDATCCVAPSMQRRIAGACFVPNTCSPDRLRGRRRRLFPAAPPSPPAPSTAARRATAPPAGASGRSPTLGFAGRLLEFKNLGWLVERLEELDCNLVVQGIDSEEQSCAALAALAARRGAAHRLRFLPPAPRVGTLLRSVDAMVVLSLHEGFPMVVVEAGMLGVPVIATRAGALPELFAAEILFLDAAAGLPDPASLRRALAALDPEWGLRLRRRVALLCSRTAVASLYAARLRELLAAPRAER